MTAPATNPGFTVRQAREADHEAIGDLTVAVYVDGGVISTDPRMQAAHRLYGRMGFVRAPERDWSPNDGVELLAYVREL